MPSTAKPSFDEIFAALKPVLTPYSKRFTVKDDQPGFYCLETKSTAHRGRPLMFAAVRIGKAYVSFHLMPIYMNSKLQKSISAELKKRMQGKSCFNFTRVEPAHIAELKRLTAEGLETFKAWNPAV